MPKTLKKILLSVFVVGIFVAYFVHDHVNVGDDTAHIVIPPSSPTVDSQIPAVSSAPTVSNPPTNPVAAKNKYRDGSYTGDVVDAYYGNVQVKAVVSGGKITDVQFLQYPNDRATSREINQEAMPALTSEAIAAQVAQVDVVSGATQTSLGFIKSLQSALTQAQS